MITQQPSDPVPQGYREGLIQGIAVVLGFSLVFLKFIVIDPESGNWTVLGAIAAALCGVSCGMQMYALWRGLQIADNQVIVYDVTVKCFGVALLILGLTIVILIVAMNIY
jgi:hypothetical protein